MKRLTFAGLISILLIGTTLLGRAFAATPMSPPDVSSQASITALWSNENVIPVVWIYNEPTACSQARRNTKTVMTITPNRSLNDGELSYAVPAELSICMEMHPDGDSYFCREGEIKLQFFEANKEYRGEYKFTMSDGSKRESKFRAQYCPTR